eukprot:11551180-Karenia_brevis.AAC.1
MSGYRMWTFNFIVALGQVDIRLSDEVKKLLGRDDINGLPENWDPSKDSRLDQEIYDKYKSELYGGLVSLTSGEPLGIMRGLQDKEFPSDGFKALVCMSQ